MKNRKVCPKCGGTDILRVEGKAGAYGSGNNIMTGMTIFSAVLVHRYVCCDCGYSEEWIDKEDIQKLKERFFLFFRICVMKLRAGVFLLSFVIWRTVRR